jgi:hypothetical protein
MTWIWKHSDLMVGLVFGFYLSLYSGLIVARWARFEGLRYELIRILQSLEWPPGSQTFVLTGDHRPNDITLISSDLLPLGHSSAGQVVMKIGNEVCNELDRRREFLTSDQKERQFTNWITAARTMTPSMWVILDPRPRLYRKVPCGDA